MPVFESGGGNAGAGAALRDTLFGDVPLDRWPPDDEAADVFPWSAFIEARRQLAAGSIEDAKRSWRNVLSYPGFESRHYLQAWTFLREHGESPPAEAAQIVLGMVVEMSLPEDLDLLAVYLDGGARYYNRAGGGIVLEHAEGSLAELIDALLAAGADIVRQIGLWEGSRPGPPSPNDARLSFLTPSGLYFGEGPANALYDDPLAGSVLRGATAVMTELIALDAHR
jgi:hypothetical protein